MNQTIEVIVDPQGQVKVQTKGFTGSACKLGSAFLEQALGVIQAEKLTAEYYAQQPATQQVREGQA